MADLGTTFDANSVEPQTPFEVIPPGKYKAEITASDMRATKDGTGQYLWLEFEVLDGEHKGRKLFDRLNLVNPNQQAVDIAQRALSALCHATGQLRVNDSEQLHHRPVEVTVRVRPGREANGQTYDASNEIRGYAPVAGSPPRAAPTPQRQAATAQAPQQRPAQNAAPWKQKPRVNEADIPY